MRRREQLINEIAYRTASMLLENYMLEEELETVSISSILEEIQALHGKVIKISNSAVDKKFARGSKEAKEAAKLQQMFGALAEDLSLAIKTIKGERGAFAVFRDYFGTNKSYADKTVDIDTDQQRDRQYDRARGIDRYAHNVNKLESRMRHL